MPNGTRPAEQGPKNFGPMKPRGFEDFMPCLLAGMMHAMPYFLEAFLACIAGGPPSGDFDPGDRRRC